MTVTIHHGDSREVLKGMSDASVDSVVCDPPYALVSITKRFGAENAAPAKAGKTGAYQRASAGFMGKQWDTGETAFAVEFWAEVYRVLKPGGHVVAFSGTRTYHRLACAVEDAGFEIRDMLSWLYGSGFPKSHDVSKGIDRGERGRLVRAKLLHFSEVRGITGAWLEERGVASAASFRDWTVGGHVPSDANWKIVASSLEVSPAEEALFEREVVARAGNGIAGGTGDHAGQANAYGFKESYELTTSATDAARQWEGWGTALKPACEPIVFARKPLGTCGVNVVDVVEFGLRNQGVEEEIRWTSEPANGAAKSVSRRTSSSTVQPPAGETSAAPVGGSETGSGERPTARNSALTGGSGATPTLDEAGSTAEPLTPSSAPKSSPHTAVTANVAESKSKPSSPSITSTAAEPNTGGASTAKSTPSCDASDSPATDTGCFAGIATGLTGSLAHVHISRNLDGSFVWPKGLPKRLDPQPLTVAANVLAHGTGALNIDGCRVPTDEAITATRNIALGSAGSEVFGAANVPGVYEQKPGGRWPANVVHDGSPEVVEAFPDSNGVGHHPASRGSGGIGNDGHAGQSGLHERTGDSGSAARFFYTAKAGATDRLGSKHPTVKPTDLMRWLVRLVTPPGGTVLDPFAGSGSTGVACIAEGFDAILIEREAEYVADIRRRIAWAQGDGRLTAQEMQRNPQVDDAGAGLPLFGGASA